MESKPDLVEAYFDRELTLEESQALRAWLLASESNRASFAKDSLLYLGLKDTLYELSLSEEINDMQLVSSLNVPGADGHRATLKEMLELLDPGDEPLPLVDITTRILAESALARQQAHEARLAKSRATQHAKDKQPFAAVISPWLAYGSAIAAVIALAFIMLTYDAGPSNSISPPQHTETDSPQQAPEPIITPTLAKIISQIDARWANDQRATTAGTAIDAGYVHLVEGMVQLEYANGAVLTLEAPTSIRFDAKSRVYLESGHLYARSDQGQLVVETPYGIVTDLGTAFGVVVAAGGVLEAHVFEGTVTVKHNSSPDSTTIELVRGQAVKLDRAGQFQTIESNELAVVTEDEYDIHQRAAEGGAQAAWLEFAYALRRNPNLLLYLSPSTAEDAGLADSANLATGLPTDRVWSSSADGRADRAQPFLERSAILFDFPDDKLIYELPESYTQLTMSVWINMRNQGANGDLRSLVMAYGEMSGDLHWQLKRNGAKDWTIHLGVSPGRIPEGEFLFESIDTPLGQEPLIDRWVHLTTVIDTDRGTVRNYVDGSFLGEIAMPQSGPIRLGRVVVGNWDVVEAVGNPMRYLGGGISDLFIFDVTLDDTQVKELYEQTARP